MKPRSRRLVFLIDTDKISDGQTLGDAVAGRLAQRLVDTSAEGTPPEAMRRQPAADDLVALVSIGLRVDEAGEIGVKNLDLLWAALGREIHENHRAGRQLGMRDAAYLLCENTVGDLWDDYSDVVDVLADHAFERGEAHLLGPDPENTTLESREIGARCDARKVRWLPAEHDCPPDREERAVEVALEQADLLALETA